MIEIDYGVTMKCELVATTRGLYSMSVNNNDQYDQWLRGVISTDRTDLDRDPLITFFAVPRDFG